MENSTKQIENPLLHKIIQGELAGLCFYEEVLFSNDQAEGDIRFLKTKQNVPTNL